MYCLFIIAAEIPILYFSSQANFNSFIYKVNAFIIGQFKHKY